jgi:hypothetical protein
MRLCHRYEHQTIQPSAANWLGGRDEALFELRLSRSNYRLEFQKRGQLFIRTHNETLSVAAMRVWVTARRNSLG